MRSIMNRVAILQHLQSPPHVSYTQSTIDHTAPFIKMNWSQS